MKKSFTGPFWFLLIIGILYTSFAAIGAVEEMKTNSLYRIQPGWVPIMVYILIALISVLFFFEAIVYWRLRRLNEFYLASWTHCILMIVGFLSPSLFIIPAVERYRLGGVHTRRTLQNAQLILTWGLVLLANVFFIWVIIQCRRKKQLRKVTVPNAENLLDEFAS